MAEELCKRLYQNERSCEEKTAQIRRALCVLAPGTPGVLSKTGHANSERSCLMLRMPVRSPCKDLDKVQREQVNGESEPKVKLDGY